MPGGDGTQTYTVNKDGSFTINGADGEVRLVKEADLLAVKGSGAQSLKDVEDAHKAAVKELEGSHKTALSEAGTKHSESHQEVLRLQARIETLEEEGKSGATSAEELTKVKQELETAQKAVGDSETKVLEYRRQAIVTGFNVPADTIKDKTSEQLDAFEEALKAIGSKGTGNYATAPGGGGAPIEELPLDRARRILADAEAKGHVYSGKMTPPKD